MAGRIILVSGACGTGKTSIARILAEESAYDGAVHMHTDDFYEYIRKGYIAPWLDGSGAQNETVIASAAAGAERFALGGYEVFVDGVVGPWFLKPWVKIAEKGMDVRYVVLRPDEPTTILRATERNPRDSFPLGCDVIKDMWHALSDLGVYEANVADTTAQTIRESVALIQQRLLDGDFRIG